MSYFVPYIDSTGFHYPTYQDMLNDQISQYQTIYGNDIYLGQDSQDYQFMSSLLLKIYDNYQTLEKLYNNLGPQTAIGSGLDRLLKINGIKRLSASYSTCQVIISGTPGNIINNGVVSDVNSNQWSLPASVTIGDDGTVTVSAQCQVIGAITAAPGDISNIVNPMSGWTGVTNNVIAIPGQPIETDAEARSRQAKSVSIPSQTILDGMVASLLTVANINRVAIYENVTSAIDANGLPGHSFTIVAEGGTDQDVADAIYYHRGIGATINGTTTVNYTDSYGNITPIKFYRPSYQEIDVTVTLHALNGYTSAITTAIKQAIYNFLTNFGIGIGATLALSSIEGIVLSVMTPAQLANPLFSIRSMTMGLHGLPQGSTDIALSFNQATTTQLSDIVINLI